MSLTPALEMEHDKWQWKIFPSKRSRFLWNASAVRNSKFTVIVETPSNTSQSGCSTKVCQLYGISSNLNSTLMFFLFFRMVLQNGNSHVEWILLLPNPYFNCNRKKKIIIGIISSERSEGRNSAIITNIGRNSTISPISVATAPSLPIPVVIVPSPICLS